MQRATMKGTLATGGIIKYPFTTTHAGRGAMRPLPVCHHGIALLAPSLNATFVFILSDSALPPLQRPSSVLPWSMTLSEGQRVCGDKQPSRSELTSPF